MAIKDNSGKGPPFVRVRGHRIRYLVKELQAWAASKMEKVE